MYCLGLQILNIIVFILWNPIGENVWTHFWKSNYEWITLNYQVSVSSNCQNQPANRLLKDERKYTVCFFIYFLQWTPWIYHELIVWVIYVMGRNDVSRVIHHQHHQMTMTYLLLHILFFRRLSSSGGCC